MSQTGQLAHDSRRKRQAPVQKRGARPQMSKDMGRHRACFHALAAKLAVQTRMFRRDVRIVKQCHPMVWKRRWEEE